jgi:hypothetical protein
MWQHQTKRKSFRDKANNQPQRGSYEQIESMHPQAQERNREEEK